MTYESKGILLVGREQIMMMMMRKGMMGGDGQLCFGPYNMVGLHDPSCI